MRSAILLSLASASPSSSGSATSSCRITSPGVVIDSDTALPLPTINVAVSNRGWGFIRGSLVWDKDYIYQTVSDEAGRFRISYRVGSSAQVIAEKRDWQTANDWFDSNTVIVLRLKKQKH